MQHFRKNNVQKNMKAQLKQTGDKPWECELKINIETVDQYMVLLELVNMSPSEIRMVATYKNTKQMEFRNTDRVDIWEQLDIHYHKNMQKIDEECGKYTRTSQD